MTHAATAQLQLLAGLVSPKTGIIRRMNRRITAADEPPSTIDGGVVSSSLTMTPRVSELVRLSPARSLSASVAETEMTYAPRP